MRLGKKSRLDKKGTTSQEENHMGKRGEMTLSLLCKKDESVFAEKKGTCRVTEGGTRTRPGHRRGKEQITENR